MTTIAPPASLPAPAPEPRKRRRWIVVLVILTLLVAGLVVGYVVADAAARDATRDYLRERIVEVLGLDPDTEVEVTLEGSALFQVIAGRLASVDVSVPDLAFGALSGSAEIHAEGIPFDETEPLDLLRIDFEVPEERVSALAGNLSGLELESIALEEPNIVVETSFRILGFLLPIGMALEPSAADGQLLFTPTGIQVGDENLTADQIRDDALLTALAGPLLAQQSFCLAEQLPRALVVTAVEVRGDVLALTIVGDGAALGGPELAEPGSCAA